VYDFLDQYVDDAEAEEMLEIFCNEQMPYFPFVTASGAVTELRRKKPFLILAILTVSCRHDLVRQSSMAKAIRELVSRKLLNHSEPSLDVLQGLMVYLAW
jgi:hypothetical protein